MGYFNQKEDRIHDPIMSFISDPVPTKTTQPYLLTSSTVLNIPKNKQL